MYRYLVVLVNVHDLKATVYYVFDGEEGADKAHEAAKEWNEQPGWKAFVVGL
jgi:hypothetical protein